MAVGPSLALRFTNGERVTFHCPREISAPAYMNRDGHECVVESAVEIDGRVAYRIKFDTPFEVRSSLEPYAFPEELTPVQGVMI